jgi:hypothetical protein
MIGMLAKDMNDPIEFLPNGQIVGFRFNSKKLQNPQQKVFSWLQILSHVKGTSFDLVDQPANTERVNESYFAGESK